MKKNALISAILTIALCASVIAGSTYALFTSSDEVNVAMTAGNVEVVATAENIRLSSTLGDNLPETSAEFIEGTNTLEISNIVPGDVIEFDLRVHNASNVTIAYRTILTMVEDNGLFEGLTVEIDGASYKGAVRTSAWTMAAPGSTDIVVPVKLTLPENADNEYKNTSCTVAYRVEAVQGNASFADTLASVKEILADGGEVFLMDDLTVTQEEAHRSPYGNLVGITQANGGVIDGNGNTLTYEDDANCRVILTYGGTIKNLTVAGGERGIVTYSPTEDVIIDNVVVDGPGYAFNTAELTTLPGIDLIVTNTTLKGWSSFNGGFETITFADCFFGENTTGYWQNMGYDQDYDRLARPYTATLFDACTFEQDFYIDLSALAAGEKITLKDCVSEDGTVLTKDNYDQYITIELPSGRSLADCVVFPVKASTQESLQAAISGGDTTVYLSAGTYEFPSNMSTDGVTIIGEEGVVFEDTLSGSLTNATIKNVHIKAGNAQRWAYSHGTLLFENCTFEATGVYAIHYDGLNGANITYKNCTIIGWAAIGSGAEHVTFDGCTIKGNGAYGVIRLYSPGTIKNCTFDVKDVNAADVYQDGIHAVDCNIDLSGNTNVNGDMSALYNVSGTGTLTVDGVLYEFE